MGEGKRECRILFCLELYFSLVRVIDRTQAYFLWKDFSSSGDLPEEKASHLFVTKTYTMVEASAILKK